MDEFVIQPHPVAKPPKRVPPRAQAALKIYEKLYVAASRPSGTRLMILQNRLDAFLRAMNITERASYYAGVQKFYEAPR